MVGETLLLVANHFISLTPEMKYCSRKLKQSDDNLIIILLLNYHQVIVQAVSDTIDMGAVLLEQSMKIREQGW